MKVFGPIIGGGWPSRPTSRRLAMGRMVAQCLASARQTLDEPTPPRWPLDRQHGIDPVTVPAERINPAEIVGGYVRLRMTIRSSGGSSVGAGAVLPAVAYDQVSRTFTLQLAKGKPGVRITAVPVDVLDVVLGMPWEG